MSDSGDEEEERPKTILPDGPEYVSRHSVESSHSDGKEVQQTEFLKINYCEDEEKELGSAWPVLEHFSPLSVETFCSEGKDSGFSELHDEWSEANFDHLPSLLMSSPTSLKELELSRNSLKEWEVEQLCADLESPHCRLTILRLSDCNLSERFFAALDSALELDRSCLRELDLSGNKSLMDSGVKLLSTGLGSQHCRLSTLILVCCELTESSCASLRSALESNPYYLKVLDLSGNCLRDAGVRLLCYGLKNPDCKLKTLRLGSCSLSENSCDSVASTLKSNPSHLEELDLSLNQLRDSGIKLLFAQLRSTGCKLKTLRLTCCLFSDDGCAALVSALTLNLFDLTELDLSGNELQCESVTLLTQFVKSSACKLKTLRVDYGRNLISSAIVEAGGTTHRLHKTGKRLRAWRQRTNQQSLGTSDLFKYQAPRLRNPWDLIFAKKHSAALTLPSLPEVDIDASQPRSVATPSLDSDLPLDPHKVNAELETEQLKDNLPFTRTKYSAAQAKRSLIGAIEDTSVDTSSEDSDLTLDPNKTQTQRDWSEYELQDQVKSPSRFTPDLVNEHGRTSYRFKFLCPGVFQCDLTGLVFKMIRDGELVYRTTQWDEGVLDSARKIPAGPLFNIQDSEDAVSQLHLPHCAKQSSLLSKHLSVAHIGDDGMSILEPVEITDTHVVVDVPHCSAFGLVWDMFIRLLNIHKPISGQVLLFHRPTYTKQSRKLNVFLLPENVPLQEVKGQQENAEYIEAPSRCQLIQDQPYSLHCSESYRIQPQWASFDFKYGPNYHPTFEIRLTPSTEEATVTVQDREGRQAWEYHIELTASSSPDLSTPPPVNETAWFPAEEIATTALSAQPLATEAASLPVPARGEGSSGWQFCSFSDYGPDSRRHNLQRTPGFLGKEERKLFSVRKEFINRVSTSVLKDLLDVLLQERVINSGEMEDIQAMPRTEKASALIDMVLRKGQLACKILTDAFCEQDPFLSEWLQLKTQK